MLALPRGSDWPCPLDQNHLFIPDNGGPNDQRHRVLVTIFHQSPAVGSWTLIPNMATDEENQMEETLMVESGDD